MNLLARKKQLVIAKQGADLLRKKRAIGVLSLALGYDVPKALIFAALSIGSPNLRWGTLSKAQGKGDIPLSKG